jgi:rhodanese-related sulfurtransferase
MTTDETSIIIRRLGIAAGVLGLSAVFAGSPYAAQHGHIDVEALSRAVQHEDDHVTAIELAGWIKNRRPGLRVVDVRSAEEFDAYHLPMAERIAIDSLTGATFAPDETIVLYSEGGAHAAQAWVFLRALGYEKVYFLRGGVYEWLEQVMNPTLRLNAPAADSAAFAAAAEISRYFGGTPQTGVVETLDDAITLPALRSDSTNAGSRARRAPSTSALVTKIRRRGC